MHLRLIKAFMLALLLCLKNLEMAGWFLCWCLPYNFLILVRGGQDTKALEEEKVGVKGLGRKKPEESEHLFYLERWCEGTLRPSCSIRVQGQPSRVQWVCRLWSETGKRLCAECFRSLRLCGFLIDWCLIIAWCQCRQASDLWWVSSTKRRRLLHRDLYLHFLDCLYAKSWWLFFSFSGDLFWKPFLKQSTRMTSYKCRDYLHDGLYSLGMEIFRTTSP